MKESLPKEEINELETNSENFFCHETCLSLFSWSRIRAGSDIGIILTGTWQTVRSHVPFFFFDSGQNVSSWMRMQPEVCFYRWTECVGMKRAHVTVFPKMTFFMEHHSLSTDPRTCVTPLSRRACQEFIVLRIFFQKVSCVAFITASLFWGRVLNHLVEIARSAASRNTSARDLFLFVWELLFGMNVVKVINKSWMSGQGRNVFFLILSTSSTTHCQGNAHDFRQTPSRKHEPTVVRFCF